MRRLMLLWGILGLFFIVNCDQRLLVDQLRWDFLKLENELWNMSSNGLLEKGQDDAEIYLVKEFYNFDRKLQQMPQDILYGTEPLRNINDFLFLYSELNVIQNKYEKFREYLNAGLNKTKNGVMMEDMIYDILNNKTGVAKSNDYVHDLAFISSTSIARKLLELLLQNDYNCKEFQQSQQQVTYNFYNLISLNDLKVYAMEQFAYLGNRLWDKGNNVELSVSARKKFEKRAISTVNVLRQVMVFPRNIWKCDPKNYVKGHTYEEFTRLIQGHIQNEVDMSSSRTCKQTCSAYSYTRSYGCYDYESEFCRKVERCSGNLIGCRFVEAHASICLSSNPSRRYDYVRYNSGYTLGKSRYCSNRKTVNSWTRWFVRCHYCMCLCEEHGPKSDRYISLRPVMADTKNNRVVTGLRLVKRKRILHIQIQEGKLLPYGYIDKSTVHWVDVDEFTITDSKVRNGEDFFTLTYEHRSMALDDIQVNEANQVMTGVRFDVINNKVHFEIYVTPFNWHNGSLEKDGGYYIYETNPGASSKIDLSNTDVPIYQTEPSKVRPSHPSSYVEFTHTDFGKDAAQTTIPFIDTQEVVANPPVPLKGAGIHYKGNWGYGGFIAPLIKTYDFNPHVSSLFPDMDIRQELPEDFTVEIN